MRVYIYIGTQTDLYKHIIHTYIRTYVRTYIHTYHIGMRARRVGGSGGLKRERLIEADAWTKSWLFLSLGIQEYRYRAYVEA